MDARKIPPAIQWHEGMMLAPQHFQQAGQRQESLLNYHTLAINPFHWGVKRWSIDQPLLVSGKFRVLDLEAVMPDGLVVTHGHSEDEPLEIDLSEREDEIRSGPLKIHLALPEQKTGEASFKGDLARFDSVEGRPVTDENTGDNELSIPRLRPRLSLLAMEETPQKYVSFPLAEVAYKNETFALTEFLPPALSVPLNSPLGEMSQLISKRLREKAVYLSEQVRSPSSASGGAMILESKNMINALVAPLPQFEAILNTSVAHPYLLYLGLCNLVGNVAALGSGLVPPALTPYDHDNVRACFHEARQFIFRMIEEGIQETYMGFPFTLEDGSFRLHFAESWMTQHQVYLGVRGPVGMPEKDVIQWVEKSWIGTTSNIPSMREKRILGPERTMIESDRDIVPARGVILFTLNVDPQFIDPEQELQIFNTADALGGVLPQEIVLYVKTLT